MSIGTSKNNGRNKGTIGYNSGLPPKNQNYIQKDKPSSGCLPFIIICIIISCLL